MVHTSIICSTKFVENSSVASYNESDGTIFSFAWSACSLSINRWAFPIGFVGGGIVTIFCSRVALAYSTHLFIGPQIQLIVRILNMKWQNICILNKVRTEIDYQLTGVALPFTSSWYHFRLTLHENVTFFHNASSILR